MNHYMKTKKINDYVLVGMLETPMRKEYTIIANFPQIVRITCEKTIPLGYYVKVRVTKRKAIVQSDDHEQYETNTIEHIYHKKKAEKRFKAIEENLNKILNKKRG